MEIDPNKEYYAIVDPKVFICDNVQFPYITLVEIEEIFKDTIYFREVESLYSHSISKNQSRNYLFETIDKAKEEICKLLNKEMERLTKDMQVLNFHISKEMRK